jgi:hypothetical protein
MIKSFGGVSHAALVFGSVYVIGMILPWFLPETKDIGLPEDLDSPNVHATRS